MHGERVSFMWLWLMNKETEKKKNVEHLNLRVRVVFAVAQSLNRNEQSVEKAVAGCFSF